LQELQEQIRSGVYKIRPHRSPRACLGPDLESAQWFVITRQ
jgi:hypothetical protein